MNDLGTLFWRRGSDLYCVHDDGDCLMRNDKPRDITPTKHIGRLHFDLSGIGGAK